MIVSLKRKKLEDFKKKKVMIIFSLLIIFLFNSSFVSCYDDKVPESQTDDFTFSDENYYDANEILNDLDNPESNSQPEEQCAEVFSKNDWRLLLINKQHPVPTDYEFELGTIKGTMQCDARIIDDLHCMLQAAKDDGINLVICSPYRDIERQEMLFNRKVNYYMKTGLSYLDAYRISAQTVTIPGASEHQVGLALDIVSDSYTALDEGFGNTDAGKWLSKNSCNYGFILRYPRGKEHITSISYEPWHFRYVGVEAAEQITKQNLTLEEFIDLL